MEGGLVRFLSGVGFTSQTQVNRFMTGKPALLKAKS